MAFKPISSTEFEAQMAGLELARKLLRSYFEREQVEEIPENRRMSGIRYKNLDDQLLTQIAALEERWKITRFIAASGGFDTKPKPEWSPTIHARLDQPVASQQKRRKTCSTKGCPYPRQFMGKCGSCLASSELGSSRDFNKKRGNRPWQQS